MSHESARTPSQGLTSKLQELQAEVSRVFTGKPEVVEMSIASLLAGGHLLLEDVPGTGKTTLAKTMARALDCSFTRIQFTSDMLPSDVTGTFVYHPGKGEFSFRAGPIFSNIVLADEINRSSPRTQSALLEAMNEHQVTIDGQSFDLAPPFFVVATQNPKELHGTYPLPESQLDRFLISLSIGYPDAEVERRIIGGNNDETLLSKVRKVIDKEELLAIQKEVREVSVKEQLIEYIHSIIHATRNPLHFEMGASPRAGIQMLKAARALAVLRNRTYVIPDDIRRVAPNVLAHRLVTKSQGQLFADRGQALARVEELLDSIQVP